MSDDSLRVFLPKGPWKIVDSINTRKGTGYIHIKSADGGKVCDIFPFAGVGGVGPSVAQKIAEMIIAARDEQDDE